MWNRQFAESNARANDGRPGVPGYVAVIASVLLRSLADHPRVLAG
jgi:hypothetical protein